MKLLHRCQSLPCDRSDQGPCYVDIVRVVFPSEDGFGCTRDVCAECGGDRSSRSMKKEQTQRRKTGGLEIQPFGDCRIEQTMRRTYIEAM